MTEYIIRKAKREDCQEIMRLVKELAEFEKMLDAVKIDAKTLERDGFDTDNPPFECLVVEGPEGSGHLLGYAIYSMTYGIWEGRRYWLEDIMVAQSHRGKGVGNKLFGALCKEALKNNVVAVWFCCTRMKSCNQLLQEVRMVNVTEKLNWQYSMIQYEDIVKGTEL